MGSVALSLLPSTMTRSAAGRLGAMGVMGWCLALSVGCATPTPEPVSKSFRVDPFATQPRLDIEWRRSIDRVDLGEVEPQQFATPTLHRQADRWELFVGTDSGTLFKYRASDGNRRWRRQLDGAVHASPTVTSDHVFVGTLQGVLYALDRQSGDVTWKTRLNRGIESSPTATDETVFVATHQDRLIALDISSGETRWTYERSTPEEFTVKGSGTPVVDGQTVYCGFADGTLAALEVESGDTRWTSDLSEGEGEFTDVDEPVVVDGNRVYALSHGVGMFALDRKTGNPVWRTSLRNAASYVLRDDTIYLTIATGRVIALDAENGKGDWSFDMENYLPVDLSQAGPYLMVSTSSGPLYILDRETGYPLSTWKPSSGFNTPAIFSSHSGYLFSNKGYLYSFRLAY